MIDDCYSSELNKLGQKIDEVARLKHLENKELFENRYLAHDLSDLKSVNESLREQLQVSKLNNSLIERGLLQTSQAIVNCVDESKMMKTVIIEAKEKIASIQSQGAIVELETEKIVRELERSRAQELILLEAGEQISRQQEQLTRVKEQLELENNQFKFQISELEKVIQIRQADEAEVESQTVKLEHQLQEIETNTEDLRVKNAELESELSSLRSQIQNKEASIDNLRANIHSLSKLASEYSYLQFKYISSIEEHKKRSEANTISRLTKDNHRIEQLQEELNETLRTISQG